MSTVLESIWPPAFCWKGALVAFLSFHGTIGFEIIKYAYLAYFRKRTTAPENRPKLEAAGHLLNYTIQVIVFTVIGAYLSGVDAQRGEHVRSSLTPSASIGVINFGIISIPIGIIARSKIFSDFPWLRRHCIYLMHNPCWLIVEIPFLIVVGILFFLAANSDFKTSAISVIGGYVLYGFHDIERAIHSCLEKKYDQTTPIAEARCMLDVTKYLAGVGMSLGVPQMLKGLVKDWYERM